MGKTLSRRPNPVSSHIEPVPRDILKTHQDVTLSIDVFFMNKLPFFTSISANLHFGTVQHLETRYATEAAGSLKRVIRHYFQHWFRPVLVKPENKFRKLASLVDIAFNFCGKDEHVPDVELHIRTLKDRVCSGYNLLPFKHIPRIIIIHLVQVQEF